ncbi:HlyD family efflux transporter periplasmic adaptor subunit [Aliarcobacter butzleri]|uniref:HlyD family efflux transporter periplasmic adaptor subunit n=1 Tax=Aliarcobacter butzleri TaxID=28197 RepID=UPI0021B49519|nr:HlyD family efflux transporter periplasmic adaptor subunit [Aliarcobacter butzleri]MCT7584705.1 HlyD family efflux transporter periplasmic adaptor subunit [Aliarcobacter butzleri]
MKVDLPYTIKLNPLAVILGSFFILLIPFLLWSYFAKLEQISRANGQVIAVSKKQAIQSANDGVVKDIYVKEGQLVKKGEVIARLELSEFKADVEAIKSNIAATEAHISRLKAEVFKKDLVFTPLSLEYPEFVSSQKELFKRKQDALNDEIKVLQSALKLARDELNLNLPLVEKGDIGATELIRLKRQVAELEGEIINKRNKYLQESQSELTKYEQELSTLKQEFTDKSVTLERAEIYAPVDAIVNNILITTKGAKLRAGDTLMELVPIDDLVIEAKLKPSEISFIKIGQKALVKLDAYDFSLYGSFDGEVKHISSDTILEKTAKGDEYFFRVLVSLNGKEVFSKAGKKVTILPGMGGQIDIITGERTVLSYLAKPIIKTLDESFTER